MIAGARDVAVGRLGGWVVGATIVRPGPVAVTGVDAHTGRRAVLAGHRRTAGVSLERGGREQQREYENQWFHGVSLSHCLLGPKSHRFVQAPGFRPQRPGDAVARMPGLFATLERVNAWMAWTGSRWHFTIRRVPLSNG